MLGIGRTTPREEIPELTERLNYLLDRNDISSRKSAVIRVIRCLVRKYQVSIGDMEVTEQGVTLRIVDDMAIAYSRNVSFEQKDIKIAAE